jgi:long-chain fatty acid transport protein
MIKTVKGCTIAAALLGASTASAGGLWLNEFGDFSGGRAAAGAAAGVDDAMTIAYNPASISRLEGSQLFVSAGALIGQVEFDVDYNTPRLGNEGSGNAANVAPLATSAYVHDFGSSKWSAGVSLVGLAGAGLDYDDGWAGRYQATKVELLIMALSPTVAYQVTDKLSVGASLQIIYSNLNLHLAGPRLDPNKPDGDVSINGDDTLPGFTLGTMYELSDRTRFGLFYQSEIKPKFDGDLKTSFPDISVSTDTKLPMAEYVRFSVHQEMDEQWAVDFTVGWDNWSTLGNVLIATDRTSGNLDTDWRDTYHVAWGAQYKWDNYLTLTGGVAYDSNPVSSQNRNAQLPVGAQMRYAMGAQYALSESLILGGYVNYIDMDDIEIEAQRFGGKYTDNNVTQLMANMIWKF